MALTFTPPPLPATRSGRTFAVALAILGLAAVAQLLILGGYLIGGGVPTHHPVVGGVANATPVESKPTTAGTLAAPTPVVRHRARLPPPVAALAEETGAVGAGTRPTPAPAPRAQNAPY